MPTLQSQTKVNASPDALFDYLADFKRHPEWAAHPLTIESAGEGAFTSTSRMMGEHHAKLNVVESDRPNRLIFDVADDTGEYRHTIAIQAEGQGALLTKTVTMTGGNVPNKVIGSILMPIIGKKIINQDVQRIKERVEAA